METKNSCITCTRRLVEIAYQKSFLFRLLREPLKIGMKLWVKIKCIDVEEYKITNDACLNCNRFYKNALKDKSSNFRWLNSKINPIFDNWLECIVTAKEIKIARKHAEAASNNKNIPNGWNLSGNLSKWNKT
ncbi:MAG: hypothetical protein Q7U47_08830 [Paludibacter sp.]|nr:hypothetical protein [Paludibacter sp.]